MSIPDDVKPFVKEDMKRSDYQLLGHYLIKKKLDDLKCRIKKRLRL